MSVFFLINRLPLRLRLLAFAPLFFITTSAFLALLIYFPTSLNAFPRDGILQKCWSPAALKGTAKEIRSKRSRHGVLPPKSTVGVNKFLLSKDQQLSQRISGTIRRVKLPKGVKLVALTFDLGEASYEISGYDGGVVDYLRSHKIKATFFIGGKWFDHHSERAQQLIADPLFEIGNHGWAHKNLRRHYGKSLKREIVAVQDAYKRAYDALATKACLKPSTVNSLLSTPSLTTNSASLEGIPQRLSLFRFPFGTCHKQALAEVKNQGLLAIQWDVVTGDPAFGQSARRIARIVKQSVRPGSIIIAHANGRGRNTAKALPLFIPDLLKQGYQFVTVSELLAAGEPVIAKTCYENRPGDNSHY